MLIIPITLGPLDTNCYIVQTGEDEAVCIDPAAQSERIRLKDIPAKASEAGLTIKKILLTHGHFDHTGAAEELKKAYDPEPPIIVSRKDDEMMHGSGSEMKSLAFFAPKLPFAECVPDEYYEFDETGTATVTQGNVTFTVIETPGHTAGSVCILCKDENGQNIMFSGDTLFKDSIGRSDGFSGDTETLYRSLDRLKALDGNYIIYPGHGESTTLDAERRYNPFLADFV